MTYEIHARGAPADPWKMIVRVDSLEDVEAVFSLLSGTGRYAALELRTEDSSRPLRAWQRPSA
jgi:hypothetical protein